MAGFDTDDNFVSFGTALEPIEEEEVARKKPITLAEQTATDEKGRRRFHGAFTGGFSAGYFNTVGSKEGWTPSTFKSSRSERFEQPSSKGQGQNVMDFMDDEDMGAFGIAPQVLRPTDAFASEAEASKSRKRPKPTQSDGPIPGVPVLHQIIEPVKETVGIKILVKMGWRQGQGVGPRVAKKKNKSKTVKVKKPEEEGDMDKPVIIDDEEMDKDNDNEEEKKVYGCQLPAQFAAPKTDDEGESSDDEIDPNVLYAPDDVDSPLCNPKENTFGLGYKGLERMSGSVGHVDLFGKPLKFKVDNKKLNITGEAFGIGAFEEPDEDVYSREDMTSYDFELETAEERRARKTKEAFEKSKKKHKDRCIEGFHIAKTTGYKKKYFPPPHLPSNFEPFHNQRKSRFEAPPPKREDSSSSSSKRGLGRHALSVAERQVLLGEQPSTKTETDAVVAESIKEEGTPQSINNNKTSTSGTSAATPAEDPAIQERVERIKKFVEILQTHSSSTTPGAETLPSASKPTFQPFMKNPDKQDRYEKYLTLMAAGFQDCLKDLQPPELKQWEREREKHEFERAAAIYKPLKGVMQSRFVTAKSHDISHIVPEKEILKEKDPTEDPKVAARLNLFGKLTHTVVEWHPDKVLCKRFNIKDPYPDSKFVGLRGVPSKSETSGTTGVEFQVPSSVAVPPAAPKKSLFDNLDFSKPPPGLPGFKTESETSDELAPPGTTKLEFDKARTVSDEKENVPVKAPLDLFKEIFADSSSESENEEIVEDTRPKHNDQSASNKKDENHRHKNESESSKRGTIILDSKKSSSDSQSKMLSSNSGSDKKRGIFDNLDLSQLNKSSINVVSRSSTSVNRNERIKEDPEEDEEDVYGPKAPIKPNSIEKSKSQSSRLTSSSSQNPHSGSATPSFTKYSTNSGIKTTFSVQDEEVVWVEKEAVSKSGSKKSKKHSSKKGSKKSKDKDKKKDKHKSKKNKHKSKKSKHKISSGHHQSPSGSSSDDSSSSVEIHGSLNSKALLAQLKKISRSNS